LAVLKGGIYCLALFTELRFQEKLSYYEGKKYKFHRSAQCWIKKDEIRQRSSGCADMQQLAQFAATHIVVETCGSPFSGFK
jgi:hypothetical protein